jgi:hypothetical protein
MVAPSGSNSDPGLSAEATLSWGGGVTTAEGMGGLFVARQPDTAAAAARSRTAIY